MNENLHRWLRNHFDGKSGMSIETFISLIILFLVKHNRQLQSSDLSLLPKDMCKIARETITNENYTGYCLPNSDKNTSIQPLSKSVSRKVNTDVVIDNTMVLIKLLDFKSNSDELKAIDILLHSSSSIPTTDYALEEETIRTLKCFNLKIDEKNSSKKITKVLRNLNKNLQNNDDRKFESLEDFAVATNSIVFVVNSSQVQFTVALGKKLSQQNFFVIANLDKAYFATKKIEGKENDTFSNVEEQKQPVVKNNLCSNEKFKKCRCGVNSKTDTDKTCNSGSRCFCFQNKIGCDSNPRCGCRGCNNPYGKSELKEGQEHEKLSRKRNNQGKLIRQRKTSFYDQNNMKTIKTHWSNEECILLFEIRRQFKVQDKKMICDAYNLVRET